MGIAKCVGCLDLERLELEAPGGKLVVYNCSRKFPYACAISGLLRPGKGIVKAVEKCPRVLDCKCILCSKRPVTYYGDPPVAFACKEHDWAWQEWLEAHPERRAYLAPKQRVIRANWIEVFREFIEDMRPEQEAELIAVEPVAGASQEEVAEELSRTKPAGEYAEEVRESPDR